MESFDLILLIPVAIVVLAVIGIMYLQKLEQGAQLGIQKEIKIILSNKLNELIIRTSIPSAIIINKIKDVIYLLHPDGIGDIFSDQFPISNISHIRLRIDGKEVVKKYRINPTKFINKIELTLYFAKGDTVSKTIELFKKRKASQHRSKEILTILQNTQLFSHLFKI